MLSSEQAAAWRACNDPRAKDRLWDGVARAVRARLIRRMRAYAASRIGSRDVPEVEDRAQLVTLVILDKIRTNEISHGGEDRYIDRAARNAALDVVSGKGTRRAQEVPTPQESIDAVGSDPFEDAEAAGELLWLQALIRELIPQAPASYREILEQHYLGGVPQSVLADEELARRGLGGKTTDVAERTKAQQVIYKRAERARTWLQREIAKRRGEG